MLKKRFAAFTLACVLATGMFAEPAVSSASSVVSTTTESVTLKGAASTTKTAVKIKKKSLKKKAKKKKVKKAYTKYELKLMSSIIFCEAGGESYQGKVAVGIVAMNRVKSKLFPNTLKGVIYQRYQFTPTRNGMLSKRLKEYSAGKTNTAQWKECIKAAKKTLSGQQTIVLKGKVKSMKGYHFFSQRLSNPRMKLGGHRFK